MIASPQQVVFRLALLGAVALLSLALMRSDLQHRSASVIDPLTSMLNRHALRVRVEELGHQARIVQQPIGLIVADLDHFKAVNDVHGHAVGDAVLRDVAYCLRKRLRAFDLAYRLGGEEFLVLSRAPMPAGAVSRRTLREAIVASPGGVAGDDVLRRQRQPSQLFDYERVFAAADQALYEAKAAGRNCVRVADGADISWPLPDEPLSRQPQAALQASSAL